MIIDYICEIWQGNNLPDMTMVMQHLYQIKWPFETGSIKKEETLHVTFTLFRFELSDFKIIVKQTALKWTVHS